MPLLAKIHTPVSSHAVRGLHKIHHRCHLSQGPLCVLRSALSGYITTKERIVNDNSFGRDSAMSDAVVTQWFYQFKDSVVCGVLFYKISGSRSFTTF